MAYDNGTAAIATNPATLGFDGGGSRIDVMVGIVGPDVAASGSMGEASADAFFMRAICGALNRLPHASVIA